MNYHIQSLGGGFLLTTDFVLHHIIMPFMYSNRCYIWKYHRNYMEGFVLRYFYHHESFYLLCSGCVDFSKKKVQQNISDLMLGFTM